MNKAELMTRFTRCISEWLSMLWGGQDGHEIPNKGESLSWSLIQIWFHSVKVFKSVHVFPFCPWKLDKTSVRPESQSTLDQWHLQSKKNRSELRALHCNNSTHVLRGFCWTFRLSNSEGSKQQNQFHQDLGFGLSPAALREGPRIGWQRPLENVASFVVLLPHWKLFTLALVTVC